MLESASALRSDPQAHAAAGETDLGRDLESVQRKLAQAGRILQQDEGPDRLAALERLRALVRGLKADQQRLAEAAKRGGASGAEKGAQAAGGKQPSQSRGADGASAQSGSGGSTGPYAGYDRGYSIDPSTIRQQVGARMRDISSLHGDFDAIGDLADDVQAVLAALNESRVDGAGGIDLETLRMRQAELLARLQNLELALRESPETKPDSLIARHSAELAPRYQSLVEQYYRRLSEEAVSR